VPLKVVSVILDYSSIAFPGDVYGHVSPDIVPALLDVVTDPNALEIPPHLTAEEIQGFALAVGKIVLGGGVGDVVHLARANLRNIPA
jgi:hypothetical protein